jgi:hypothetical protein
MTPTVPFASSLSWVIAHFLHSQDVGGAPSEDQPITTWRSNGQQLVRSQICDTGAQSSEAAIQASEKKLSTALARY